MAPRNETQPEVITKELPTELTAESPIVRAMMEQNALLQKQLEDVNKRLEDISKREKSSDDVDYDPDDLKRRPPEGCYLRCYNGSPIVETKLSYQEEVDKFGNIHQIGVTIDLKTLDGQTAKMPYGSTSSNDYLNLEKKLFKFANCVDETGASKVDRGVVIEKGQIVIKRNPGEQVMVDGELKGGQGRVQQVVRKDIRYYTIIVDGKTHELHEDILSK